MFEVVASKEGWFPSFYSLPANKYSARNPLVNAHAQSTEGKLISRQVGTSKASYPRC